MQSTREELAFQGATRRFLKFAPEHPDGSLLIGLHGATQRGSIMARTTGFAELPQAAGMTLVFPDAADGLWRDGRDEDDDIDDVGFIDQLITHLLARDGLDPSRVFLVGMSNGGFLSQRLVCELEGRFRAVATVIATMGLRLFQQAWIDEVPSLFLVAGSGDPIIPFHGGATPNSLMASADAPILGFNDLVAHWKSQGGFSRCSEEHDTVPALGGGLLEIHNEYCAAEDGRLLRATVVEDGGHQWYGREVAAETVRRFGATTTAFKLSEEILAFFRGALRTERPG